MYVYKLYTRTRVYMYEIVIAIYLYRPPYSWLLQTIADQTFWKRHQTPWNVSRVLFNWGIMGAFMVALQTVRFVGHATGSLVRYPPLRLTIFRQRDHICDTSVPVYEVRSSANAWRGHLQCIEYKE